MKKNYYVLLSGLFALSINSISAQCPVPSGVTATPTSICVGQTTTLNATAVGATINWYSAPTGGTLLGTSGSGANIAYTPTTTTTYYAESFITPTSYTFNYTGGMQTYTVPMGVTSLSVDVYGAQGGFGYNVPTIIPGLGGRVQAVMAVTPGEVLNIWVGGKGGDGGTTVGGTAGFNGGGTGGGWSGGRSGGGGGGGGGISQGGGAGGNRVVIGAGGGGTGVNHSSGDAGGNAGGLNGSNGLTGTYLGSGGTQIAGGSPDGALGNGGNAPAGQTGGGGGGGYYGGGSSAWEGGGGGSSYATPTCTDVTHTGGFKSGNGQIFILGSVVGCTSTSRAPITVSVNPLPTIAISGGNVCVGSSYTLNPTGAATYTFSGGSAIVSPSVNTTYSVTGTSAFGCAASNTAVATIGVYTPPTISVNSGSICAGNSFTIITTGADTYTYSGGSAIVSPSTTTSYSVSGTSTVTGCVSVVSAVSTVTVNGCVGLQDLTNADLNANVYPNPNKGLFTVELISTTQVIVTNVLGDVLINTTFAAGKQSLDLKNNSNGVYFVKLIQNNKQQIVKVIKE